MRAETETAGHRLQKMRSCQQGRQTLSLSCLTTQSPLQTLASWTRNRSLLPAPLLQLQWYEHGAVDVLGSACWWQSGS